MTTDERRKLFGAMVVRCACGGSRWRPDGPDGERCVDCGAWSPCSTAVLDARQ